MKPDRTVTESRDLFGPIALLWAGMVIGGSLIELRRWSIVLFAIAIVIFAVQQLALMPLLHSRSLRIIAGETLKENGLHLIYIVAESVKVIVLLLVGFQQGSRDEAPHFD